MRLMSKLVINKTRYELIDNIGIDNLCVGVPGGCEGAINAAPTTLNALQEQFRKDLEHSSTPANMQDVPVMLMLDASNAFNEHPRALCLLKSRQLWPSASRFCLNIYRGDADLIVQGEKKSHVIKSEEGTTQGCPLAGLLFSEGTKRLQEQTREETMRS